MKGAAGSDPAPGDAAGWIARVRSGPLSEADRSRLEAWLAASPTNERAFAQLASNLAILDVIRSEPEILAMREAARHAGHGRLRRWSAVAAGLAVLSLIVSAATYLVRLSPAPMGSTTIAYATDVGEIGRVRLPDGSLAVLDARSSLRVTTSKSERRVELLAGRAYVEVAPDARRPFVFHSMGRKVTALGTRFDVNALPDGVEIVLVEGRVRVEDAGAPGRRANSVEMVAGFRLVAADPGWSLAPVDSVEATSWRTGMLVFDEARVGDVVAEMNRYLRQPIVINDPALAERRLSAVLRAGDVATFFALLEELELARGRDRPGGGYELIL